MPRKRGALLDKLLDKYPNHPLLEKLIAEMDKFFKLLSMYESSNCDEIFVSLCIQRKRSIEVAEDNYIHVKTVGVYVDRYTTFAKQLIMQDFITGIKEVFGKYINL